MKNKKIIGIISICIMSLVVVIVMEDKKKQIHKNSKKRKKIGLKLLKKRSLYSLRYLNVRVFLRLFLLILMDFRVNIIWVLSSIYLDLLCMYHFPNNLLTNTKVNKNKIWKICKISNHKDYCTNTSTEDLQKNRKIN